MAGNMQRRLACCWFSDHKDEDLTIARRLLGVEMTTGLGSLRSGEMEEWKDHGFDGTFRLFILTVVVIFLLAAFLVLVDFHFVVVCLCAGIIITYHMQIWFCLLF